MGARTANTIANFVVEMIITVIKCTVRAGLISIAVISGFVEQH